VSVAWTAEDRVLLGKLNQGSWERTFSPQQDVDWSQSTTTKEELGALYDAWSLLRGTGKDDGLQSDARARFAAYQQMNLMQFTAIFERFALPNFDGFFGDDEEPAYHEYVAHLIKEETYHYLLFMRAIAKMRADDASLLAVPKRHIELFMHVVLWCMRLLPSRWLRHGMSFFFLRFAEEITLQANTMAKRTVPRPDSLVPRVWELHALDEARHVAFDDLMMRKARGAGPLAKLPGLLALPVCVCASLLLNLNEIWAARRVGAKVGYHHLPMLMKKTSAPFKRRVFALVKDSVRRLDARTTHEAPKAAS
jgi:P-aminobenzoate N-oxygenase AurF